MPVKLVTHIKIAQADVKGLMVEALNRAAIEHVTTSRLLAPIQTGALRNSINQTKKATVNNTSTEVDAGDDDVDYASAVNYGHHTKNGYVAAQPFWEPGIEAGIKALTETAVQGGKLIGTGRGSRSTFVHTTLDPDFSPGG